MREKTEAPTPRKLRKARAEGDHAVSQPLVAALGLLLLSLLIPNAGSAVASELAALVRRVLSESTPPSASELLRPALVLSLPLVGLAAAAALVSGLLQTGGAVSVTPLRWQWQRLSPGRRLAELGSGSGLVTALRVLAGVASLAALGFFVVRDAARELPALIGEAGATARFSAALCRRLLAFGAALLFAFALLDWLWVRGRWLARQRMSREEVARERRENDGDPELKRLRQRVYREWLTGGELGDAARATLIVVGPPRWATALAYDPSADAPPRVLIQAPGALGRALLVAAYGFRVAIWHDPELARRLAGVAAGDAIPRDLFAAVAKALVDSHSVQQRV
jgi:flagellar biosynthetic protein FlhB